MTVFILLLSLSATSLFLLLLWVAIWPHINRAVARSRPSNVAVPKMPFPLIKAERQLEARKFRNRSSRQRRYLRSKAKNHAVTTPDFSQP